jgi:aminoglycoside phosphotransferase (APT) family kinase protein
MTFPAMTPSSNASEASETSTLVYIGHEPFETFGPRVYELCRAIWPMAYHEATIVERMKGGGFNRITGMSIVHSLGVERARYILRVPRFEDPELDRDVAILKFVSKHSTISVPEIIAFDITSNNVLKNPYMIQKRIPGVDLYSAYPGLSHEDKCMVAEELGQAFLALQRVRSQAPGELVVPRDEKSPDTSVMIRPFHDSQSSSLTPYKHAFPMVSTLQTLLDLFEVQRTMALKEGEGWEWWVESLDRYIVMASEMDALGYLSDNQISLCHLDLAPRNIHVTPKKSPIISAILDWDSAVFVPRFMSCAPPMWLWAWNDDEDEDERLVNEPPATAELCEVKRIFDEAAGPYYVRFAYEPQYRLARILGQIAIRGTRSNEEMKEADEMLKDWDEWKLKIVPKVKENWVARTKISIKKMLDFFVRVFSSD